MHKPKTPPAEVVTFDDTVPFGPVCIESPNPYGPRSEWVSFLRSLEAMEDSWQVRMEIASALRWLGRLN